ncbi:MAG: glycosyltransferase family 39 protein [Candidatus Pacebacteria bacterium]|nr:glycosyltransferase family 39 protein [Candidatus Paceibacterota bacterium]MDR3583007.1 glycosyltransferase family 39 protein [Candidatus Paceibacterota bacterium]
MVTFPTENIKSNFRKNKKVWPALFLIILAGIFLRTYDFRKYLTFSRDQFRDLKIVQGIVEHNAPWPLLGPNMTGGQGFQLGPAYYWFQIISAKIFGVNRTHQAYPDVFFSILSIPLLYYFLRKYFSQTASLLATAVYAFSYFDIEYSRFAWNVNLIPFFVLIFLVSFGEFLTENEKTGWRWIVLAGFALGIGVQLHAIIMLLLPAVVLVGSAILFWTDKKIAWKKMSVILLIALALNITQPISELQTKFANTKDFQKAFLTQSTETDPVKEFILDVTCNAEANTHAISSLGDEKMCDFLYADDSRDSSYSTPLTLDKNPLELTGEIVSLLFSFLGIGFLIVHFGKETDRRRKYFLGLIMLYSSLYFLIMLSVAPGSRMRYYLPIIFLSFVFLAFIFDYLIRKYPRRYVLAVSVIFLFLIGVNLETIFSRWPHLWQLIR